jgi:hypothetical protein
MIDPNSDLSPRLEALREFLKMDRRYAHRVGQDQPAIDARIAVIDEHLMTLDAVSDALRL